MLLLAFLVLKMEVSFVGDDDCALTLLFGHLEEHLACKN